MSLRNLFELLTFFIIITIIATYLASYMDKVFEEKKNIFNWLFRPLEKFTYKVCRINSFEMQSSIQYLRTLLIFTIGCFIFTFVIIQLQYYLPLNPQKFKAPSIDTTFNIVSSYITNT
ncbi:MAG: potassium-transporting ATPase subunit KdpA, partial [Proteobacteria bacterium]|nr:potassium-transporting ATPase subunit KdpA [Pseudomonadota bacterium]